MTEPESISWVFGGVLAGLPAPIAWSILGVVALAGFGFITWSYRRALVEISRGRRIFLCFCRSLPWLALLVILAAPTRVQRAFEQTKARPLAVLVDQSGSMTTPDNRQRRRLDDALRRWRELEPTARRSHSEIKTFAFAERVQATTASDATTASGGKETKLFAALQQVVAQAPAGGWGGVVTLTDGLDTSGAVLSDAIETTTRTALSKGTALYFVPGRNRYAGAPFFGLREFNVPDNAAPKSSIRVEAIFDSFQPAARTIEIAFKVNGVARPAATVRLEAGRRLTTWSAEVPTGAPGPLELELRAGEEVARAAVRVGRPPTNRILYFQGALDWSYRFLADILKRDPSFQLTPVFNFPNPKAALPPGALRRMPELPRELENYDIVILANAAATQFNDAQQTALSTWVRDGGVLLFFTPDDDSTSGFAGTELEKMLPVVFAPPQARRGPNTSRILAGMRGGIGAVDQTKLVPFEWETSPRVREIFAESEKPDLISPVFSEFAHVAKAKPGADVLARHPVELAPDGGEKSILLAVQRYGRGQSGVLTTDALWRWKMNRPADDQSTGVFWHALFAWLTREHGSGLRFEQSPRLAELGHEVVLRVAGAKNDALSVEAAIGDRKVTLASSGREEGSQVFRWQPPTEGFWLVTAKDGPNSEARHWVAVRKSERTGELSGAAPDEELLRMLAARTGGSVLENLPPPAWQETPRANGALLAEHREPLWHRDWIFGALLGLYCTEMLLRRKWRML